MISCCRRLRHLTIRGLAPFCEEEGGRDGSFLAALAGAASLECLTLDNSEPDDAGMYQSLPQSWDALSWASAPALSFLEFFVGRGTLDARDWRFIENCAQSIQTLHLTTSTFDANSTSSLGSTVFPQLQTLDISSRDTEATAILGALAASPLTSLSLTFISSPSPTSLHFWPLHSNVTSVASSLRQSRLLFSSPKTASFAIFAAIIASL